VTAHWTDILVAALYICLGIGTWRGHKRGAAVRRLRQRVVRNSEDIGQLRDDVDDAQVRMDRSRAQIDKLISENGSMQLPLRRIRDDLNVTYLHQAKPRRYAGRQR
jgi:cell division protein FtsB